MRFRKDILVTKFCLRARTLPSRCLLSLLHQHHRSHSSLVPLSNHPFLLDMPVSLNVRSINAVQKYLDSCRVSLFATFLSNTTQVLIQACHPDLGVDPILFLPASRVERGRLVRWRMGWLPGNPRSCACETDHTSCRHLAICPRIPSELLASLPIPPSPANHPIDFAISSLPSSSSAPCLPYWVPLLTILWHINQLCNPDGEYSHEKNHGALWHAA
ncbi:hypothetical protein CLU79DRAFT_840492 [Phycomyces nitens]|nr:hypothetical protein CLU79DRAFT_840492 [Phycomyces nitens]